ncbi:MAG: MFS transporter [Oscillospiraceae bacterium]
MLNLIRENRKKHNKWLILVITSVSTFMATLDGSIVNIALPGMAQSLGTDIRSIQWVITSYLLTISLLLLMWGKLADSHGNKRFFSGGFLVFALGSAMCAFSGSLELLVISRVVQAVGASSMMALSQGIVTQAFEPHERGRALGLIGTMVALGSLTGPSLGGLLLAMFSWKAIFLINIPIGLLGCVFAVLILPESARSVSDKAFDFTGFGILAATLSAFFLGLLFTQEGKLPTYMLLPSVLVFAAGLTLFIRKEKRTENPLISLGLFKSPVFSTGLLAALFSFIVISSILLFMPFYLQSLLGFSPLKAGLVISVYPITTAFVAPLSGWLSDKLTFRPLTIAGMGAACLALVAMLTFNKTTHIAFIIPILMLFGAGVAMFQSPNSSSVMGAVERSKLGIAGGINALSRNLGLVSGNTFSILLFSFTAKTDMNAVSSGGFESGSFLTGFHAVILFTAICAGVTMLLSVSRKSTLQFD